MLQPMLQPMLQDLFLTSQCLNQIHNPFYSWETQIKDLVLREASNNTE